jgi:UPF0716 family protein affecting phage T7 exclusion
VRRTWIINGACLLAGVLIAVAVARTVGMRSPLALVICGAAIGGELTMRRMLKRGRRNGR